MGHELKRMDEVERIPTGAAGEWLPLRRALGITSVGVNAYAAERAGEEVIESHTEQGGGSAGHEEVYVVLSGRATFTIDGEERDAPTGTVVKVDPETRRAAAAAEDGTTVLVMGGKPGAALPAAPYEWWYVAEGAYRAGDYERAIELASPGLADWPEHPSLHYQLACYHALAGHREQAVEHLRSAYAGNPATREWAAGDEDLASMRDDATLGPAGR
jgi:tetratricopeptide (TPR) repeat protein